MKIQVNYIWVHNPASVYEESIPSKFFACFQKNAFTYRDVPFNLWVEDISFCQRYFLPKNVTVRFLHEGNIFSEHWKLKDSCAFEAGIDLLRLLVLRKMLSENPDSIVIYSDFDVFDLKLFSAEFKQRINKYGMALAGAYYPARIENVKTRFFFFRSIERIKFRKREGGAVFAGDIPDSEETARYKSPRLGGIEYSEYGRIIFSDYENGFIAFANIAKPILEEMISRSLSLMNEKPQERDARDLVYFAMAEVMDSWAKKEEKEEKEETYIPANWRSEIASFYVQYCPGWRLDDNVVLVPVSK